MGVRRLEEVGEAFKTLQRSCRNEYVASSRFGVKIRRSLAESDNDAREKFVIGVRSTARAPWARFGKREMVSNPRFIPGIPRIPKNDTIACV